MLNHRAGGQCATDIATAGGTSPAADAAYSDVFPGNIIPASCQPVAADLLRFVPSPNTSNGFFQAVLTGSDRTDQTTVRIDHHINSKQNFSAYFYFQAEHIQPVQQLPGRGCQRPGFGANVKQRFQQWNLSHHLDAQHQHGQ